MHSAFVYRFVLLVYHIFLAENIFELSENKVCNGNTAAVGEIGFFIHPIEYHLGISLKDIYKVYRLEEFP